MQRRWLRPGCTTLLCIGWQSHEAQSFDLVPSSFSSCMRGREFSLLMTPNEPATRGDTKCRTRGVRRRHDARCVERAVRPR
jgi:hypothetical protein